jgi:TPR repeat protein
MIRFSAALLTALMVIGSISSALAGDREDRKNAAVLLKTNPSKAVSACRRLAEQGEVSAQLNLAGMYDHGEGVPQSWR